MQNTASYRHAFLSYMHEDKEQVDELQEALEAAGIQVWRDTQDLWPGEDWQAKIRAAIEADSLAFIACFSTSAERREKSYQYEELTLAVEQYRLRPPNSSWLFTVRFDECVVPPMDLGAGRILDKTIQRTDLFGVGKTVQTVRLSQAVARIVIPQTSSNAATVAVAEARMASSEARSRAETLKQLLRDPTADIALEDFLSDLAAGMRSQLEDSEVFPSTVENQAWSPFARSWIEQVRAYETVLEPSLDLVRLAATYGQQLHIPALERFMKHLTPLIVRHEGLLPLLRLRAYPSLLLMYVASIASMSRKNYAPLVGILEAPTVRDRYQTDHALPLVLYTNVRAIAEDVEAIASALAMSDDGRQVNDDLIDGLVAKTIVGRHTPMSDHIHHLLRDLFRDELPDDREYDEAFDRAEVLLDSVAVDAAKQSGRLGSWAGGYGRYTWRHRHSDSPIEIRMADELAKLKEGWGPVLDGLFGRKVDRASEALAKVHDLAAEVRRRHW